MSHLAFETNKALVGIVLIIMIIDFHFFDYLLFEQLFYYSLGYIPKIFVSCG